MSPRSSSRRDGPKAGAATPNVYVGLLVVAVAALAGGITFLVLELNKYDWQIAAP